MDEFLKSTAEQASQNPAKFTIAHIPSGLPVSPGIEFDPFEGIAGLVHRLEQPVAKDSCRLIIVENICAQTISLLGERFDIDPQFFADHLNNEPWYRIANVPDRIPALPSTQKYHDFLQLRYIEPRKISSYKDLFHENQPFILEAENAAK